MQRLAPLTSIRFFAAVWVVAYHSSLTHGDVLRDQWPTWMGLVDPVLTHGVIAIDVFFILSGYVLAWNYLDRLGRRFDVRRTMAYVQLRFARIWPLYITCTLLAGALIWARYQAWHDAPVERLTLASFVKQLFMVQQWFSPSVSETSWAGPAWSISAEWAAYLLLPVLALVVWRLRERLSPGTLIVLSALSLLPFVATMAFRDSLVGDYLWLLRILCEFVAGMLLCAGFSRLILTDRQRRTADRIALVIPFVAVAWFAVTDAWVGDAALVLWLPYVACLAVGSGPVTRFLSRPRLVVLGELSFALYLLHGPMFKLTRDLAGAAGAPAEARPYVEMLVAVTCLGLAWLMHRYVEEPARIALSPAKREAPHVPQHA